jgi:hypothetical protein
MSRECKRCGATFEVPPTYKKKQYCTRACSSAATAEQRAASNRANGRYKAPVCPCGNEVTREGTKYVYARDKKYCSPECRAKYGKKRQPNPDNYVTFDCMTCARSVTRYKGYGNGASKFCSNRCAAKHTKTKHHLAFRDDDVLLDSAWEGLFWCLMKYDKIPVVRVDRDLAIEWTNGHHYAPDFYLPTLGTWVEVKGLEDDEDPARWDAWRAVRGRLVVMGRFDLDQLLGAGSREQWMLGGEA